MPGNHRGHLKEGDILDLLTGLRSKQKEKRQEKINLKEQLEENGSGGNLNDRAEGERDIEVKKKQLDLVIQELANIEFAIQKLSSYPKEIRCSCGNPISLERLKAVPWAETCQDCVRKTNGNGSGLKNHYHQPAHV